MKRLKKGPELKMPELKVPDFVADLFYDLHDRRLLAPILLAVVGIAAVPFLLGGGSESPPAGTAAGIATPSEPEAAEAASLTVVEAKPGLRDYHKRLAGRKPTNPFKQRYTAPATNGAELGSPSSSSSESIASTVTTSPSSGSSTTGTTVTNAPPSPSSPEETSSGSGGGETGGNGGSSQLPPGSHLFGFRPDVRFGVAGSDDLTVHEELRLGTFLPHKHPVLIFIGVTQNGKRALFDVSGEIASVQGDGDCIGGADNCQILSIEEGQAATLMARSGGVAYRLAVTSIRFIELDVPKKASSSSVRPIAPGLAQNFSN
jgi:hypothetical protein